MLLPDDSKNDRVASFFLEMARELRMLDKNRPDWLQPARVEPLPLSGGLGLEDRPQTPGQEDARGAPEVMAGRLEPRRLSCERRGGRPAAFLSLEMTTNPPVGNSIA